MIFLTNPKRKRTRPRRAGTKRRKFSPKQLAAQRKFAAMARARAKAARSRKRATPKGGSMAKRRRTSAAPRRRRRATTGRIRSIRRRGGGTLSRSAWRASGYRRNPRRRRYRRNQPFTIRGIGSQVLDLVQSSGAALVGSAIGRTVSGAIPLGDPTNPIANFAKGALIAVAIRTFGGRVVGTELARFAAVGAMLGPTKDLIVGFAPGAEQFLGRSDQVMYMPSFPGGRQLEAYAGANGGGDVGEEGLSAYAGNDYWYGS